MQFIRSKMSKRKATRCYAILLRVKQRFQFAGKMSSLHGLSHIFSPEEPLAKRVFWSVILSICCFGAGTVLKSSLSLESAGGIAYSLDSLWLDWDTPFPAVTVCEQPDTSRVKNYLKTHNIPESFQLFYKDVSYWNIKYCRSCGACKLNSTCTENFEDEVKRIRLNCSDLLSECWWGEERFRCCDRFLPTETEYGTCFTFNSMVHKNASEIVVVNRKVGLPKLVFNIIDLTFLRIHAPDETVSVLMDNLLQRLSILPLMANLEVLLQSEQIVNAPGVRSLSPSARDCLFRDEKPANMVNWPFRIYTHSVCVLYCRAMAQNSLCNCTHHFMSHLVKMPACNVEGLACLSANKDEILKYSCSCPSSCDEILYRSIHTFYNRTSKQLDGVRSSRAVMYLSHLPSVRYRRFGIRDKLGLVVDIGGVGGIFFGASLLSIIEFVYLFCIRKI